MATVVVSKQSLDLASLYISIYSFIYLFIYLFIHLLFIHLFIFYIFDHGTKWPHFEDGIFKYSWKKSFIYFFQISTKFVPNWQPINKGSSNGLMPNICNIAVRDPWCHYTIRSQHIKATKKWPTFCRWHFQIHFVEWMRGLDLPACG